MNNKIYINGRFLTQEMTGIQRVATEISLQLQNHYKDKIIFICPNQPIINPYKDKFNIAVTGSGKGYFWEQIELPRYLYKIKANILLNFSNTAPLVFNKNVVVIHDMSTKPDKGWFDWKYRLYSNFLFNFSIKSAKKIITVSNFSKSEIVKYYPNTPADKIDVIYLASFMNLDRQEIKKKDYFLAVNSLNARKNITAIIDAFKINNENYILKIVGGENKKIFGTNDLDISAVNIEFLGSVNDAELYDLMLYAKGFINAAWYEGFGLPPLEAMSLKTPCILSDIPVYRELYDGVALFFDPARPDELAHKINELYHSSNYEYLREKSYELSQKFSWDLAKQEYIKIIDKELHKNMV